MTRESESSHNDFLEALRRFDEIRQTLMGIEPVQESDGAYGVRYADFRRAQACVEEAYGACVAVHDFVYGYYSETGTCFLRVPRELRASLREALTNTYRWDELRILADYSVPPEVALSDDELVSPAPHPHVQLDALPALPLARIFRAAEGSTE